MQQIIARALRRLVESAPLVAKERKRRAMKLGRVARENFSQLTKLLAAILINDSGLIEFSPIVDR